MKPVRFQPLAHWPYPSPRTRAASAFRATWTSTLELLDRELWHRGVRELTLGMMMGAGDTRIRDGWPKECARPSHPGVALSWRERDGAVVEYACDRYPHWQYNMRALALHLQAERTLRESGVRTERHEVPGEARKVDSCERPPETRAPDMG